MLDLRLIREKPDFVKAAMASLGSDAPIGKLRGTVHRWRGVPVVVSYHPAYLLRQPADKARAWDDLCLAHGLLAQ